MRTAAIVFDLFVWVSLLGAVRQLGVDSGRVKTGGWRMQWRGIRRGAMALGMRAAHEAEGGWVVSLGLAEWQI